MSIAQNFPAISPSLLLDFANVQALDPRITFARATTGTYYGTRTALAEQNLFTYSQEFDVSIWSKNSVVVTANSTIAPDGTTTADTINEGTSTSFHAIFRTIALVTGTSYSLSVFAKVDTGQYVTLSVNNGGSLFASAIFDVSAGTVASSSAVGSGWGVVSTSIASVGNNWFRCVLVFTSGSTASASLIIGNSNTATAPLAGSSGLVTYTGTSLQNYIWGAQLEQRSTITAYTPTTTQPVTNYIPVLETAASGVARFDHNPTTFESLGLLIEQQSTNLVTYSEQFDNAAWTKTNVTVTANTIIAPDGTLTGDKLIANTTSGEHKALQTFTASAANNAITVYAKAAGYNWIIVQGTGFAWFDVLNGTVGTQTSCTGTITAVGNGWYRCSIVMTSASNQMVVWSTNANGTTSFAGDGFGGAYIWGAQVESLAFPTSYIPTVASQVTRAADSAIMTGTNFSQWYNQAEGTIYSEYNHASTATNNPLALSINANTNQNQIALYGEGAVGEKFFVRTNTVIQATITASPKFATGIFGKIIGAYKTNDFSASANGNAVVTDIDGLIPIVSQINIGSEFNNTLLLNGTIKKIAYYPIRLSNTNLQALTG
jgi:hypothetical protein